MKKYLIFLFLTVFISCLTAYTVVKIEDANTDRYGKVQEIAQIHNVNLTEQQYPDFTFAAETAVKAVVHVKVLKKGADQPYSFFDFFFGNGAPETSPKEEMSAGSGVIITSDGYVVTNNHVIEGAKEIMVTLENNGSYKARLVGSDVATDIALLKIEARNLPYIRFGDSDSLRLGEWVLAIGNPYNLRSTITAGIVSAKARSIPSMSGEFKIESFIQTDAAVNSGNSGGALVNTQGELIGINTAIASRTGAYSGYSFAVPSSIARKVVDDLTDFGSVRRAMLGVSMQEIDSDLAKIKNIKDLKGVYIAEVSKGGAAEKAGIRASDILRSINGVEVNSAPSVQEQISKYSPKDRIKIGIVRNGKQKDLSVVLESKSGNFALNREDNIGISRLFGASLRKASKQNLDKLGIKSGIEVFSVTEGRFKQAGVKPGFIITYINQIPVEDLSDIKGIVEKSTRSLLIEGIYPDGSVVYYGIGI